MALFDFLFKRKKDEPQPAAEDRPSENPPAEEAAESAETPEPPSEPAPTQEPETLSDGLHPENEDETAEEPAKQEPVEEKEQPSETQPTEEQPTEVRHAEEQPAETGGWTARLKQGLSKSRDKMAKSLAGVFGGGKIDEDLYEELETVLLTSDMGIEATEHLMDEVRKKPFTTCSPRWKNRWKSPTTANPSSL